MRPPTSVAALTKFGRVRLSKSFFMRDFLFSEIAAIHGLPNIPDDPDLAIDWQLPSSGPTLSGKDEVAPFLADQPDLF